LNYGYTCQNDLLTLYFHSAKDGKKIKILKRNNKACFEIDCDTKLIESEIACRYGYQFRSIIGFGEIVFLETNEDKKWGLYQIMKHQTGKDITFAFDEKDLEKVLVYKMEITDFTGKKR
jgi:nitroimidazol reductase NimA-like FMN-containing flavoprotein (pyridoxamine 5'-phosphate oxidase superfamily)